MSITLSNDISSKAHVVSKLDRQTRLRIRNEIILTDFHCGKSHEEIAEKFRISSRQVYRILEAIKEGTLEWYKSLPKEVMIAIHRDNSIKVYEEIKKLRDLRAQAEDIKEERLLTLDIMDSYIKYDKMISEGATLQRVKEMTDQAEKILATKD